MLTLVEITDTLAQRASFWPRVLGAGPAWGSGHSVSGFPRSQRAPAVVTVMSCVPPCAGPVADHTVIVGTRR
jgi:hypothetical protein